MKRKRSTRRRATILVMVVSVLALLFVIVSGFLALARFERDNFVLAQQGASADRALDNINELVLSLMREQWADGNGETFGGFKPEESAYEDIAGYRKAYWLAALEAIRDATVAQNAHALLKHRWPAVSLLADPGPTAPSALRQPTIKGLMLEDDQDNDAAFNFNLNDPANDIVRNARIGFMDADGDGMPDGLLTAPWDSDGDGILDRELSGGVIATELANLLGGTPVRLRGSLVNPNALPLDGDVNTVADDFWRRYDELARYEVAARVVPHGGMVALDSPGQYSTGGVWNREFVTRMFNWLAKENSGLNYNDDTLFNAAHAAATGIEPYLRRRGGLLPSYRDPNDNSDFGRVPDALRELEFRFRSTFKSQYQQGRQGNENWQRFNLSDPYELGRWQSAVYLDPFAYNKGGFAQSNVLREYDRRHLITANSFSDEVVREQRAALPQYDGVTGQQLDTAPGIEPGQLKFYLGEIAQAFDPQTGYFLGGLGQPGTRIVKRIAGYYHEMLSAYDNWPDWPARPGWTVLTEDAKRLRQAYMLAVNTVAAAAPLLTSGFIDVVRADVPSTLETDTWTRYVGYAPQPFITQVIAYDSEEDPGAPVPEKIALAIELYNPNEPMASDPDDTRALYTPQFAISLNDQYEDTLAGSLHVLDGMVLNQGTLNPALRMSGRSFLLIGMHNGDNDYFRTSNGTFRYDGTIDTSLGGPSVAPAGSSITVKLWRADDPSSPTAWHLVDEMEVELEVNTQKPPPDDTKWYVDVYRDTHTETYWGENSGIQDSGGVPRRARWRGVVSYEPIDTEYQATDATSAPTSRLWELGHEGPGLANPRFGPTVPLYTPNAPALNDLAVNGAARPRSYPTVGFLAFVPRFSHVSEHSTNVSKPALRHPVSAMLRAVWKDPVDGYGFASTPADFGHMPVLDNTQSLKSTGYGNYFANSEAGHIPWGLLVFDYFTTLNPDGVDGVPGTPDDIDLYRVPGRINVNAAPWFVLAGLPVVNPQLFQNSGMSPAFWNVNSGVLMGVDLNGAPRFDTTRIDVSLPTWWRLGPGLAQGSPGLAQAVAAYRDRIKYLGDADAAPYVGAERRNVNVLEYRYRDENGADWGFPGPVYGSVRRGVGTSANPTKYGFVSLGELLNVRGMDSGVLDFNNYANQPTYDAYSGDYVKAVSLLALLDTHFLTTRGNTFTVYVTVRNRVEPNKSVRSQITVDRSNMLPRLVLDVYDVDNDGDYDEALLEDPDGPMGPKPLQAVVLTNDELPTVIAPERRGSYNNARFDD